MEKRGYTVENIYQGGYSTLDPNKGYGNVFTGYRAEAGSLGITTDPRTANIIKEVSSKLSSGLKNIEVTLITPRVMDAVPQSHLKEINRLKKLTGIDVSVHGPVIDTAGISQQGYDEMGREQSERVILNTLERSHEIDPQGNISVTFHSSEGIPGSEWKTLGGEKGREFKRMIAVDRESGKMIPLKEEERFYPGGEKGGVKEIKYSPETNLEMVNHTQWDDSITQVEFNREHAERILQDTHPNFQQLYLKLQESRLTGKSFDYNPSPEEMDQVRRIYSASEYIEEGEKKIKALFSKAYEIAKEDGDKGKETIQKLKEASERYSEILGIEEDGKKNISSLDPKKRSEALFVLSQSLRPIIPNQFISIEEFAADKSAKTFGNAAFDAYKKFKDSTPIINIENPPIGHALSTGEDLRNLVEKSRKVFEEKLIKENNLSESEAKKIAEKTIGATWDVGHINMLRKQGFGKEEIVKETEKVAKFVKHVHLSDNFGMEHTELPMGMGNVPIKEIMEKLGKEGYDAKKIIEAGDWWQHFQTNPAVESLEGLGSPMTYSGKAPYWNQAGGLYQNYFGGFGMMLPQINYETFGSGFSQLPMELGGQRQGAQGGRMSGRPME